MATDIVQTLFGITPEGYQQQQAAEADRRALAIAQLNPMQRAEFNIGRGAYQLAGALGGTDPELARISARQKIAGQLDPNDLTTFDRGIEMMRQSGDGQGAMMLAMEREKARQRAQETQLNAFKTEDYLLKRGIAMRDAGLEQLASDLAGKIRNPDGTLNQEVVNELKSFPQGLAAISAQAKIVPELRRLGAVATPEVDPFAPFVTDATTPKNVKTYAQQLSSSFKTGTLDPEKVDAKIKELTEMTQRIQQFEQNQTQLKANQDTMAELRRQGLENSRQGLLIQQQNARLAQQQAEFNQQMRQAEVDRKAEERKNKPLPAYLAKEEEGDFTAAKAASDLATDAYGYLTRIKQGEIPFGVKEKASIRARQLIGSSAPDVVAREAYDKFVTNLVNESLRLNKGTQTEGDAIREAKALQSSESREAAASSMKRLVEINTRRAQNAADEVLRRRKNAGFSEPATLVQVPTFDVQIINNAEYSSFLKNPKFPSGTVFVDPDGVRRVKP